MNQTKNIIRDLISNLEFSLPKDVSGLESEDENSVTIVYGGVYSQYKHPATRIKIIISSFRDDFVSGIVAIRHESSYGQISGTILEKHFEVCSLSDLLIVINDSIKDFEKARLEHIEFHLNKEKTHLENFIQVAQSSISFSPEEVVSKESLKISAFIALQEERHKGEKFIPFFFNIYSKCLDDYEISTRFLNHVKKSSHFFSEYKTKNSNKKTQKEIFDENVHLINKDALIKFYRETSRKFILNDYILRTIGPVAAELVWRDVEWRVNKEYNRFVCKLESATTTKVTKFKRLNYVERLEVNSHISLHKTRKIEIVRCINVHDSKVFREVASFDNLVCRGIIDYHPARRQVS